MDTTQAAVPQTSAAPPIVMPAPAAPPAAVVPSAPLTATQQILSQLTPDELTAALPQAKAHHDLVIDWVRALDVKVSPLLSASGALLAACLALLGQGGNVLADHPATHILLAVTLLPLFYSLVCAASANSPTLKWSRFGDHRHLPVKPTHKAPSVMYFGHIALHETHDSYVQAATAALVNKAALLEDLLDQTYINAKIAANKSSHIAHSTRGLFAAVGILFVCGLTFLVEPHLTAKHGALKPPPPAAIAMPKPHPPAAIATPKRITPNGTPSISPHRQDNDRLHRH